MLPAQPPPRLRGSPSPRFPGTPGEPLGIVAGGGALPLLVAHDARALGWRPVVVAVAEGHASDWSGFEARRFSWGRTGDIFAYLEQHHVRHVLMCGQVSVRPDYRALLPSWRTLRLLPEIFRVVRGGDDNLLRAVAGALDRRGLTLLAAHEIAPELLTPEGVLTAHRPSEADWLALRRAQTAATRIGALDVGQAVVASPDRVIALEGIEGTREMIGRVGDLRARGRIGKTERCVLVKAVKPQQDHRLDLPSIGASTIEEAAASGLIGIGLTAGASLMIDAQGLIEAADAKSLFLVGLRDGEREESAP